MKKLLQVELSESGQYQASDGQPTISSIRLPQSYRVMHIGDSFMTGSNVAPGGSRHVFGARMRNRRGDVQCMGPVFSAILNGASPNPFEPLCAGYPGETISQITARMQIGGSILSYVQTHGQPDVVFYRAGQNNVGTGQSFATIKPQIDAAFSALETNFLGGEAIRAIHTLTYNYPKATFAAINSVVDEVNAYLRAEVSKRGASWFLLDTGPLISAADVSIADGVHPTPNGQAVFGRIESDLMDSVFPLRSFPTMPRTFVPQTPQASVLLTNKAADNVAVPADAGWLLPADSWFLCFRVNFTDYTNVGAITNFLISTPAGGNFNNGFQIARDNSLNPPLFLVYTKGTLGFQVPCYLPINKPCWLFVHADRQLKTISVWLAAPASTSLAISPFMPYEVSLLGVAYNVPQWSAGDPNPILTIGKYAAQNGFAGSIDNVRFATGAQNVGSFWQARYLCETIANEGSGIPGSGGFLPCSDGAGGVVTSGIIGAQNGALVGAWSAAGTILWPTDG